MTAPRVLHVITSLDRGGAETALARLVETPAAIDHVGVVTLRGEDSPLARRIAAAGVPIYPLGGGGPLAMWTRWREALLQSKPDVLHACLIHPSLLLTILPRRLPLVIGIRHSLDSLAGERRRTIAIIRALALLSRRADRICYVSHQARRQHEAIGYPASKGLVIPNGYQVEGSPTAPEGKRALRARLALPPESFLVGQLARLHPIKGHDLLLRAFAGLARVHADAHLVLIGAGTDTPQGPVNTLAATLGITDRVHALGECNDVPQLLSGLDCLVNPSRSEAFPNAVAEAMIAGLRCIATDVGDTALLVGDAGVVVPPEDISALEHALLDLAALSESTRQALGQRARAKIAARFSIAATARQYADLYRQLHDSGERDALRSGYS